MKKFRLLLAGEHWIVRRGLLAVFQTENDFEIADEAEDRHQLLAQAQRLQPDLVLIGQSLPEIDIPVAVRQVKSVCPAANVLVFGDVSPETDVLETIRAGALGWVPRSSPPNDILQAARAVAAGGGYLAPSIARLLFLRLTSPERLAENQLPPEETRSLTEREKQVFQLLIQNCRNRAIAEQLFISEATVKTHVGNILRKLGLRDRSEVILYGMRRSLFPAHQAISQPDGRNDQKRARPVQ